MAKFFLRFPLPRRSIRPQRVAPALRYEVHLLGLMVPGLGLRSVPLLVGTIQQCQKYAREHSNSLGESNLSLRVRPSSGASIFLDSEASYPQKLQSLSVLIGEHRPQQKEQTP